MRRTRRRFKEVWAKSTAYRGSTSIVSLARLCASASADRRLLGLMVIRREVGRRGLLKGYWQIAAPLVEDPDNDCRWQALIVLGEFVETRPQEIWEVIVQYGSSVDSDMRAAIACVLLEDLLDHHFSSYFPAVRRRVASGDTRFIQTLGLCWVFRHRSQRLKVARLLASASRSERRRRGSLANKRLNPPHSVVTALAESSKRRAAGRAG